MARGDSSYTVWDRNWEHTLLGLTATTVALDQAGAIVEQGAKRRAPVSPHGSGGRPSGWLRSHIRRELGRDARGPYVDVISEALTEEGHDYAPDNEFGTKPHRIESKGPWPLRNPRTGQVFGRVVNHPGQPARPYMRPAIDDLRGRTFRG